MPKAVKFDTYGGVDVLEVRQVERPIAAQGRVLVRVKAAGINPGEAAIREGALAARFPATFPSGEGTDFAFGRRAQGSGDRLRRFAP
jgi:NADPH:quinone reductase